MGFKAGDRVRCIDDRNRCGGDKPPFSVGWIVTVKCVWGNSLQLDGDQLQHWWNIDRFEPYEETPPAGRLVVIESPFGNKDPAVVEENKRYLAKCLADSLQRGEAPYASHALYPGVLDDNVPDQRRMGMEAGFAWGEKADLVAVYMDRGLSQGMYEGIKKAQARGQKVVFRSIQLGVEWSCMTR